MQKDMTDLNGFEMLELKKILGTSVENADGIEATYAVAYLFKKRDDSSTTYDDVLRLTIKEIQSYMGLDEEDEVAMPFEVTEDPKE